MKNKEMIKWFFFQGFLIAKTHPQLSYLDGIEIIEKAIENFILNTVGR